MIAAEARAIGLWPLFRQFLGFGCRAFGGPVAQIAMIRAELVVGRHWVAPDRFNRLLAVLQVLPGPEAHELCVHLGVMARGRLGGLLAGLGFMAPGLALMLAAGWLYARHADAIAGLAGTLAVIQLAVLALIAVAVWKLARALAPTPLLAVTAAAALVATLAGAPFWAVLAGAGAVSAARPGAVRAVVLAGVVALLALLALTGAGGDGATSASATSTSATATAAPSLAALFVAGLKGGLLTFGGAYTAIPYVRADTVGRGWLSDASFLDGLAIASVLPAPLVIFATFAGQMAGGLPGALAVTAGMFLPAFAFSLLFFDRLERIVDHPRLTALLAGVAAGVLGIIAATLGDLGRSVARGIADPLPAVPLIMLFVAIALGVRRSWMPPLLIAVAAGLSTMFHV